MSKKKRKSLHLPAHETVNPPKVEHEMGRGEIKDNALKAAVTSQLFRTRTEQAKKGKGSFSRKTKHRGKEPYSKAA